MKNIFHNMLSVAFGCFAWLVGGFDVLIISLLILMTCDWATGVLSSLKCGKFSPFIGLWGIVNKVVALIVVVSVNAVQLALKMDIPIREILLTILIVNETLSVLKNSSTFVTGLEPLTKYFDGVKTNTIKLFKVG